MDAIQTITIYLSGGALAIAMASFVFAVLSWRETHRPVITAFIRCAFSGNISSGLEIVVSNSGNRPATNVRLRIPKNELERALSAPHGDVVRNAVERCFKEETFIPVLEGGKEITNTFGIFTDEDKPDTWHYDSVLQVHVAYEGLNGRKFQNTNLLRIVCCKGFALSSYE